VFLKSNYSYVPVYFWISAACTVLFGFAALDARGWQNVSEWLNESGICADEIAFLWDELKG
jgi:hypothetical protein